MGTPRKPHEIMTHVKLRDEDIDPNLFENWLARVRGIELASRWPIGHTVIKINLWGSAVGS
jgi:hypothetical protein